MDKFLIVCKYAPLFIDAENWEGALYQALKICGDDAIVSITKIPKEED